MPSPGRLICMRVLDYCVQGLESIGIAYRIGRYISAWQFRYRFPGKWWGQRQKEAVCSSWSAFRGILTCSKGTGRWISLLTVWYKHFRTFANSRGVLWKKYTVEFFFDSRHISYICWSGFSMKAATTSPIVMIGDSMILTIAKHIMALSIISTT